MLAVKYKETEDERNGEIQREYLGGLPDRYIVKYYCHKNTAKIETKICAIIFFFFAYAHNFYNYSEITRLH
jgi:hypothetical protein